MSVKSTGLRAIRASIVGVRLSAPIWADRTKRAVCATGRGIKAGSKATVDLGKDVVSTVKGACKEDLSNK